MRSDLTGDPDVKRGRIGRRVGGARRPLEMSFKRRRHKWSGRLRRRNTHAAEQLGVKEIQSLRQREVHESLSQTVFQGVNIILGEAQIFKGRDAEELQKSTGVKGLGTFMNLHSGMEHGDDVTIRFAMAATQENRSEGVDSGTKMQRRDNTHVRKEPEKEVK